MTILNQSAQKLGVGGLLPNISSFSSNSFKQQTTQKNQDSEFNQCKSNSELEEFTNPFKKNVSEYVNGDLQQLPKKAGISSNIFNFALEKVTEILNGFTSVLWGIDSTLSNLDGLFNEILAGIGSFDDKFGKINQEICDAQNKINDFGKKEGLMVVNASGATTILGLSGNDPFNQTKQNMLTVLNYSSNTLAVASYTSNYMHNVVSHGKDVPMQCLSDLQDFVMDSKDNILTSLKDLVNALNDIGKGNATPTDEHTTQCAAKQPLQLSNNNSYSANLYRN